MIGFFNMSYAPGGVIFTDYTYSIFPASIMGNATIANEIMKVDGLNLTRIEIENKSYFASEEMIILKTNNSANTTLIGLYQDQPAIRHAMKGAIVEINNQTIINSQDVKNMMEEMKPGENITLVTKFEQGTNTTLIVYHFALGKDYANESNPVLGTASLTLKSTTLKGFFYRLLNSFKDPTINYEPRYNEELTIFIYNLLWWIVLISISVGLSNMLPAFVFDGGRFWYLTVLGITGHKKLAERVFKVFTYLLIGVFALLMALWAIGMFF
jgi:membrane-associated protease RseP (regulator of RpoE activity)